MNNTILDKTIKVLQDKLAQEINIIDFQRENPFTDYFVICETSSQRQIDAIVSGFNEKIKAVVLADEETYALGQGAYWLEPNPDIVTPEYLVKELAKEYVTKQVKYYSKGSVILRLSMKDLLKIQVQIPSIKAQNEALLESFKESEKSHQKNEINEVDYDFIKTLKHSLMQPASSLGNDFSSLRSFLERKITDQETLDSQEAIVHLFHDEKPEQINIHRLSNTLDRMNRSITDIGYILEQAMKIITVGGSASKESIELKSFLKNIKDEYQGLTINIVGSKTEVFADRKQLRILINNFVDNAKRHGFKDFEGEPIVWMELSENETSIQISIRNNGKRLPPEFTTEDFLAKGSSTRQDVGSGFGGFLIGQILKNHEGSLELIKSELNSLLPHNVEFLITIPK